MPPHSPAVMLAPSVPLAVAFALGTAGGAGFFFLLSLSKAWRSSATFAVMALA